MIRFAPALRMQRNFVAVVVGDADNARARVPQNPTAGLKKILRFKHFFEHDKGVLREFDGELAPGVVFPRTHAPAWP